VPGSQPSATVSDEYMHPLSLALSRGIALYGSNEPVYTSAHNTKKSTRSKRAPVAEVVQFSHRAATVARNLGLLPANPPDIDAHPDGETQQVRNETAKKMTIDYRRDTPDALKLH